MKLLPELDNPPGTRIPAKPPDRPTGSIRTVQSRSPDELKPSPEENVHPSTTQLSKEARPNSVNSTMVNRSLEADVKTGLGQTRPNIKAKVCRMHNVGGPSLTGPRKPVILLSAHPRQQLNHLSCERLYKQVAEQRLILCGITPGIIVFRTEMTYKQSLNQNSV